MKKIFPFTMIAPGICAGAAAWSLDALWFSTARNSKIPALQCAGIFS